MTRDEVMAKLYPELMCILKRWDQAIFVKDTSKCKVLTLKSKMLGFNEFIVNFNAFQHQQTNSLYQFKIMRL